MGRGGVRKTREGGGTRRPHLSEANMAAAAMGKKRMCTGLRVARHGPRDSMSGRSSGIMWPTSAPSVCTGVAMARLPQGRKLCATDDTAILRLGLTAFSDSPRASCNI